MKPEEKAQMLIGKMMLAQQAVADVDHDDTDKMIDALENMLNVMKEMRDFGLGEGKGLV